MIDKVNDKVNVNVNDCLLSLLLFASAVNVN